MVAHENRNRYMNLHYHPIVILEGSHPIISGELKDVRWLISANPIGTNVFDIEGSFTPFEFSNGISYIEFDLSKFDVSLQPDDYLCDITFMATIDSALSSPYEIKHEVRGVVKVKWSKGLR